MNTSTVPRGTVVKFLLYVNNDAPSASDDLSIQDVLDPTFVYQAGTIKVDNSSIKLATSYDNAVAGNALDLVLTSTLADPATAEGDVATNRTGNNIDIDVSAIITSGQSLDDAATLLWNDMLSFAQGKLTRCEVWKEEQLSVSRFGPSV